MIGVDAVRVALVFRARGAVGGSVARLVENGLAGSLVILRVVVLLQVALAAGDGIATSTHPDRYTGAVAAIVLVSAPLLVSLVQNGTSRLTRTLSVVDLTTALTCLVFLPRLLDPSETVGTWENWAPGYVLNALLVFWIVMPGWLGLTAGVVTGLVYLSVGFSDPTHGRGTVLANAATYPGMAAGAVWFVSHLRRIGREADQARADAVEATRELEQQRYRVSVHDTTSLLAQLADPDTPAEVQRSLKRQAEEESNRLRSFVDDTLEVARTPTTLGGVLDSACTGFEDLGIVRNTDLGDQTPLDADTAEAVEAAVRTVLHNVRRHAEARRTVLHADQVEQTWELVVCDDGCGFDPQTTEVGFGLRTQVVEALQQVGVRARIESEPGEGTTVTLTGENP